MVDLGYIGVFAAVTITVFALLLMIRSAINRRETEVSGVVAQHLKLKAEKEAKKQALRKSIKLIKWDDTFIVDGGILDRDHQALFKLINAFNKSVPDFESPSQVAPFLKSLSKYIQAHFKREEKLQQVSGFIFHDEHKEEHQVMVEKYNVLVLKASKATRQNITDIAVEIGDFLQEWLTEHVIENDLQMRPFVDRMKEHSSTMTELDGALQSSTVASGE